MATQSEYSLLNRAQDALTKQVLPYWIQHTVDEKWGGFVGRINFQEQIVPEAPKGAVLNARILWIFSAAYRALPEPAYLSMADRAFSELNTRFVDPEHQGIYWMLDYKGDLLNGKKQVYAQAFAIYGLAEYYRITGNSQGLSLAIELYELIEQYSHDTNQQGYLEAFDREWNLLEDLRLSDKDANEKKTMNTHLHVLEAYTVLYEVWPNPDLRARLRNLIHLFLERIIDTDTNHFRLFFDENWNLRSDHWSYGHDIEGSWLLCEAAEAVGDFYLLKQVREIAVQLAYTALREGIDPVDGSMYNDGDVSGVTDADRHWWPQAEACVGFLNAWQLTGDPVFRVAADRVWKYIEDHVISPSGAWYFGLKPDHQPDPRHNMVGPWKCPYHNGRTCLEIMHRLS